MEEGMPADEIERLIEGFFDEITTKTERCTCEAGYTFCHNIISDINWDAELFVVTVHTSQGLRKFARYFSYYFFPFALELEMAMAFAIYFKSKSQKADIYSYDLLLFGHLD